MPVKNKEEEKGILKLMLASSEEFLQSADSGLNYRRIVDAARCISGAKYAGFDIYDEEGNHFATVALSAPDGIVKKASLLLGFKLPGNRWKHDPAIAEKTKQQTITHFLSLRELTGDVIPKPVVSLMEKTFGIGEVVFVKIAKEDLIIGSFTLVMPKKAELKNEDYLEIYSKQVGLLIARSRSEEMLRQSEKRFRGVFTAVNNPLFLTDEETGRILDVNNNACSLYGYSRDEMIGLKFADLSAEPEKTIKALEENRTFIPIIYQTRKDKEVFPAEIKTSVFDIDGRKARVSSVLDITERNKAETALTQSHNLMSYIIEHNRSAVAVHDRDLKYIYVSQKYLDDYRVWEKDVIGKHHYDVFPDLPQKWRDIHQRALAGEVSSAEDDPYPRADGTVDWTRWECRPWYEADGSIGGIIIYTEVITERKKAEERIRRLSFHDHLTGLYNRSFFEEELKRFDTERRLPLSIVMCDLIGLKIINDVFGHAEGDKLLKKVAEILKKVCRSDDLQARWGGDEFALLLSGTSVSGAEEIVQRINKECRKTRRQKVPVSLSLGASTKDRQGQDIQTVITDAESNMYKNKLAHKDSLTSSIIFALEQALYEKSNETKEHADRMHKHALKLGKAIGLPSNLMDELSLLASLHDIGKVAIPEKILLKKGRLTEKEWKVIKKHPEIGFNIAQSSPQISHIAKPILSCHENWDGSGYPMGLKGQSIPVISRIILIVDAYDVMTGGRVYKAPMSKEDTIAELKRCAAKQFDPELVEKFIENLES